MMAITIILVKIRLKTVTSLSQWPCSVVLRTGDNSMYSSSLLSERWFRIHGWFVIIPVNSRKEFRKLSDCNMHMVLFETMINIELFHRASQPTALQRQGRTQMAFLTYCAP